MRVRSQHDAINIILTACEGRLGAGENLSQNNLQELIPQCWQPHPHPITVQIECYCRSGLVGFFRFTEDSMRKKNKTDL